MAFLPHDIVLHAYAASSLKSGPPRFVWPARICAPDDVAHDKLTNELVVAASAAPSGAYILEYLYGNEHEDDIKLAKKRFALVSVGDKHLLPFPTVPCHETAIARSYRQQHIAAPEQAAGANLLSPEDQGYWWCRFGVRAGALSKSNPEEISAPSGCVEMRGDESLTMAVEGEGTFSREAQGASETESAVKLSSARSASMAPLNATRKSRSTAFTEAVFLAGWAQALALAREISAVDAAALVGRAASCLPPPPSPLLLHPDICDRSPASFWSLPPRAPPHGESGMTAPLGLASTPIVALQPSEEHALLEQVLALDGSSGGSASSDCASAPLYRPVSRQGRLSLAQLLPPSRAFRAALVAGSHYNAGSFVVVQPPLSTGVTRFDGSSVDILRRTPPLPDPAPVPPATASASAQLHSRHLPQPLLLRVHDFYAVDALFGSPLPQLMRAIAESAAAAAAGAAGAPAQGGDTPPVAHDGAFFWDTLRAASFAGAREAETLTRHLHCSGGIASAAASTAASSACCEPSPLALSADYAVLIAWVAAQRAATTRLVVRGVVLSDTGSLRYAEFPAAWIVGVSRTAPSMDAAACMRCVEDAWRGRISAPPTLARMHAGSPAEMGAMYGPWSWSWASALGDVDMRRRTPVRAAAMPRPSVRLLSSAGTHAHLPRQQMPQHSQPAAAPRDIWEAVCDRADLSALRTTAELVVRENDPGAAGGSCDDDSTRGCRSSKRRRPHVASKSASTPAAAPPHAEAPDLTWLTTSFGFAPPI